MSNPQRFRYKSARIQVQPRNALTKEKERAIARTIPHLRIATQELRKSGVDYTYPRAALSNLRKSRGASLRYNVLVQHPGFKGTPHHLGYVAHLDLSRSPSLLRKQDALNYAMSQLREIRSCRKDRSEVPFETRKAGHWLSKLEEKRARRIFENKSPRDYDKWVAIELECLSTLNTRELGVLIAKAYPWVTEFVTVKSDGSLRPHDTVHTEAVELVICSPRNRLSEVLTPVLTLVKKYATVNKSCGMHVHFDMRSEPNFKQAFARLASCQDILFKMVPESRRDNQYCRRLPTPNYDKARRDCSRYHVVNPQSYGKYKTLEVRLHGGTLSFEKIIRWVSLLEHVAYSSATPPLRALRTVDGMVEKYGIPQALHNYVLDRILTFSGYDTNLPVERGEGLAASA